MVLTARQQALSWIAALEAKGDVRQLYEVLDKALDERTLNVAEEKEALSQLYAYTGFPRSLNALGQLEKVVNDRQAAGKATDLGHDDATAVPEGFDALKEVLMSRLLFSEASLSNMPFLPARIII